jgi:hypothetical protein
LKVWNQTERGARLSSRNANAGVLGARARTTALQRWDVQVGTPCCSCRACGCILSPHHRDTTVTMAKHTIVGAGNPLLDISAETDMALVEK